MTASDPENLVSTGWLAERLEDPDLRVLDGSWHMPAAGRDARAEFAAGHVPGARFFDIDANSDAGSDLPHMAPSAAEFAGAVRALGIGDGDRIVVYDTHGLFSAARVWWLFRLFGVARVAVLDGGLPKWRAENRPVATGTAEARARDFTARRDDGLVRDAARVAAAVRAGDASIIDARAPERFRGEVPEPREGLRSGHVPGSMNVHYASLLAADGTMKAPEDLRAAFEAAGVDVSRPAITTCGSGVTAAILSLALERLGNRHVALYDGSWSEWGGRPDLEVETG